MKYINLLPPELQVGATVNRQRSKSSSKAVVGCSVILGLVLVIFFSGIKLIQYRYKQRMEERISQEDVPPPAADQPKTQVAPSRAVAQPQSPSKRKPPLIPEKRRSPAVLTPEAQSPSASRSKKKENGYTLRLGSFTTPDEAEALMQKIRKQQLEPYQQLKQITKIVRTVYVDQSSTMEEAMGLTRALEADGFESFIKIRPQGAYWVGIKSFSSWGKAQELAKRLLDLGYSAKVVSEKQPLAVYQVNLGHYKEYRQAKLMQNQLEEQGYQFTSIVREQKGR